MMKKIGVTLDSMSPYPFVNVYECSECRIRVKSNKQIRKCRNCIVRGNSHASGVFCKNHTKRGVIAPLSSNNLNSQEVKKCQA